MHQSRSVESTDWLHGGEAGSGGAFSVCGINYPHQKNMALKPRGFSNICTCWTNSPKEIISSPYLHLNFKDQSFKGERIWVISWANPSHCRGNSSFSEWSRECPMVGLHHAVTEDPQNAGCWRGSGQSTHTLGSLGKRGLCSKRF